MKIVYAQQGLVFPEAAEVGGYTAGRALDFGGRPFIRKGSTRAGAVVLLALDAPQIIGFCFEPETGDADPEAAAEAFAADFARITGGPREPEITVDKDLAVKILGALDDGAPIGTAIPLPK